MADRLDLSDVDPLLDAADRNERVARTAHRLLATETLQAVQVLTEVAAAAEQAAEALRRLADLVEKRES